MAITQTLCTSFKAELLLGVHDFRVTAGDTFNIALYSSSAGIDANTTAYTATGEVTGAGYSAGGVALTSLGVTTTTGTTSTGVGFADFSDAVFTGVTLTARGALIYNTTPSATNNAGGTLTNPAVAVIDFGSDKTTNAANMTIMFPTGNSTSAIIRVGL